MANQTWLTPPEDAEDAEIGATVLRSHLPIGKAWHGHRIFGKLAYRLLSGFGRTFATLWRFLDGLSREIDYRTSTQFLSEWEGGLGLPDKCLPASSSSAEDRRKWIAFRLNKTRWNTLEDWYALAELFGVTVRITPGWRVQEPSLYEIYYPGAYNLFPKLGRFRIYIDILNTPFGGYPYDASVDQYEFPIPYGTTSAEVSAFQCFIERIAPANVLVIWNEFPAIPPNGTGGTFAPEFETEFS